MISNAEILARAITDQVLLIDAGDNKTIGDLTNNDESHAIYNSWSYICIPLVQYIGNSGSISPSGSISMWGNISGSITNQSDLWSIIELISGSVVSEANSRIVGDSALYNSIILLSGSVVQNLLEKEDAVNKSNNPSLGNSVVLYPTQNAVKVYVDTQIASSASSTIDIENIGTGEGLIFKEVSGSVVQLKTLKAGSNIVLSNDAETITIHSTASGSVGESLFELDVEGDLMPILDIVVDDFYELDENNDIMPK